MGLRQSLDRFNREVKSAVTDTRQNLGENMVDTAFDAADGIADPHLGWWSWLQRLLLNEPPPPPQPVPVQSNKGDPQAGQGKSDMAIPQMSDEEFADAQRKVRKIAKELVTRLSRKRKISKKQKTLDFRVTMRRAIQRGGILVELKWKMKEVKKPKIIAILDCSGSMERHVKTLLQLSHAIGREISDFELFIFSDDLEYASDALRRDWRETVDRLKQKREWSGGTDISTALKTLFKDYDHMLSPKHIALFLSDLETSDRQGSIRRMGQLRKRVKKLFIFNTGRNDIAQGFIDSATEVFHTTTVEEMAQAVKQACLK